MFPTINKKETGVNLRRIMDMRGVKPKDIQEYLWVWMCAECLSMVGCRHTFCTNAAKRGISVETLKYLMGHTDISVTSNMYTHLKLEDAQREMERLERIEKEMKKCAK